jgi:hypothetical protein
MPRQLTRVAKHLVVASLVVSAACNASGREQPPTPRRNLDADVSALQLSQMCATRSDTFWHGNGYDQPARPAAGTSEIWSHQSHYNAEQKRCFVRVSFLTMQGGSSTQHQEVFDAFEGGEPVGVEHIHTVAGAAAPDTTLHKANAAIPPTPENLEWFHGLMSK